MMLQTKPGTLRRPLELQVRRQRREVGVSSRDEVQRCGACGTRGVINSLGHFVPDSWLRASHLTEENDRLRIERDAYKHDAEALLAIVKTAGLTPNTGDNRRAARTSG